MKSAWRISVLSCLLIVAACTGRAVETSGLEPDSTLGLESDPTPEGTPTPEPDAAAPQPPAEGRECCLVGCGPIFATSFRPEVDDATLRTSTLSVCRNSECFETTLSDVELPTDGPGSGRGKQFVDPQEREQSHAPLIDLVIWDREELGAPRRLSVNYLPWASNDWTDGDVYELTLKDGQGSVLFHRQTTVTYATRQVCCSTCGRAVFDGGI